MTHDESVTQDSETVASTPPYYTTADLIAELRPLVDDSDSSADVSMWLLRAILDRLAELAREVERLEAQLARAHGTLNVAGDVRLDLPEPLAGYPRRDARS